MKQVKKILLTTLILIGIIFWALFVTIIGVGVFFITRVVKDDKKNTYTLHVRSEDRLVKGVFIPSRHRKFTDRILITLNGEIFQECQLVLVTSPRNSFGQHGYSNSRRIWIPKGKININSNLMFDSYNDENISVVIRPVKNEQEPIGDLQISVVYPTSLTHLLIESITLSVSND